MKNPSGIEPSEYKVLVRPDKVEHKTKGGVLLPDDIREKDEHAATRGVLIAVSPMAFLFDDWPEDGVLPQVGDRVAFPRYSGISIEGKDGEDYRLMVDKDIAAILTDGA